MKSLVLLIGTIQLILIVIGSKRKNFKNLNNIFPTAYRDYLFTKPYGQLAYDSLISNANKFITSVKKGDLIQIGTVELFLLLIQISNG